MRVTCHACREDRIPHEQPSGAITVPMAGDFWLCPSCGELHRFTGGIVVLRWAIVGWVVRPADLGELAQLEEKDRRALLAKRDAIRGAPH